jgi:hypothetical protein
MLGELMPGECEVRGLLALLVRPDRLAANDAERAFLDEQIAGQADPRLSRPGDRLPSYEPADSTRRGCLPSTYPTNGG